MSSTTATVVENDHRLGTVKADDARVNRCSPELSGERQLEIIAGVRRSQLNERSGVASARSRATATASRVLPIPPVPVRVTGTARPAGKPSSLRPVRTGRYGLWAINEWP